MCLILFALQQREDFPLLVIANRDEYYARPTRPAHWWSDLTEIFGGRDLEAGGSWMAVNRQGRFAAVTNVREPGSARPAKLSRGQLTLDFLNSDQLAEDYLRGIESSAEDYAGFNLLVGDSSALFFYSNRRPGIERISPGIYGISNGLFDEAWPKLASGKEALAAALKTGLTDHNLMQILTDATRAEDRHLPDTGVAFDIERMLSSRFIRSQAYGTRASSIVKFGRAGDIHFVEHNYDRDGPTVDRITEDINR